MCFFYAFSFMKNMWRLSIKTCNIVFIHRIGELLEKLKQFMKLVIRLIVIWAFLIFGQSSLVSKANAQDASQYIITESSSSDQIKKVQTIFKKIDAYSWLIDGKYTSIEDTIIKLQIEYFMIKDTSDDKAWKVNALLLKTATSKYLKKIENEKKSKSLQETDITTNTKFIVTAYYSPLPWQKKYSTGTYWWDIRLNGEWTHGASWAAVHEWFLAAPKNYPFGTKIYIEGIGVWIVEDRWWAIVNAGKRGYEYDRIDVWMGYGDVGLQRALQWGKRTVDGKILGDDAKVIDSFPETVASDYYDLRVNPDSWEEEIKNLQELLGQINAYSWPIDGKYSSVEASLISYQKAKNIIVSNESNGAWYFWPKTFNAVQRDLGGKLKNSTPQQSTQIDSIDAFPNLTREEKKLMEKKNETIKSELNIKSWWNRLIIESYKRKIKLRLQNTIKNTTSGKEKEKLEYLLSLL